jgi:hypothetical protein
MEPESCPTRPELSDEQLSLISDLLKDPAPDPRGGRPLANDIGSWNRVDAVAVRCSGWFGGVPLTTSPCYGFLITCVVDAVDDLLDGLLKNIGVRLAFQPLQRLYARLAGFEVGHSPRLRPDILPSLKHVSQVLRAFRRTIDFDQIGNGFGLQAIEQIGEETSELSVKI